jgi:hypothetical protein
MLRINKFIRDLPPHIQAFQIPLLLSEFHSLKDLSRLHAYFQDWGNGLFKNKS